MSNTRLADRYAKALLDISIEKNQLDVVYNDIQLLNSICNQSKDFTNMLQSPILKGDKKKAVIEAVVGDKINLTTNQFLKLLVTKGRESDLKEITEQFTLQYNELKKIQSVHITTATAISEAVKETISTKVAAGLDGHQIELNTTVDPSLIGGFIVTIGNNVVDASIRKSLNDIKKQFLN